MISGKAFAGIWMGMLLFFTSLPVHGQTITMATNEWIPYTSERLENQGESTHCITRVFKEMGLKPDYQFYPWRRCFDSVIKGRVWATFPYAFTVERAEQVWYSDQISCSKTLFFYYDDTDTRKLPAYHHLSDLKPYRLGGVTGYFYEERFEKAGLTVDYSTKEIHALEKLIRGRIDLMPINERVAHHLIKTHFPDLADNFKFISRPLTKNPLYLIVSRAFPDSRKILSQFNAALNRCIKKGIITIDTCE